MSVKSALISASLLVLLAAWAGLTAPPATSSAASSDLPTILMMFGVNSEADERWDGSVQVSNGELVALEPRHFSRNDAITGRNSWKCSNRRDEISGFPRVNYNEMSPAELPPTLFFPVGVYLTIKSTGSTRVSVETAQGNLDFALADIGRDPKPFLGGRATVVWAPTVEKITTGDYEDDEAAITRLADGTIAVAWLAYRDRGDRVILRTLDNSQWSAPEEVTPKPGDLFRCSLAVDDGGRLWVFWSERDNTRWHIWGRQKEDDGWLRPVKVSGEGSNTFHRAASSADGRVFVVWQSFRGSPGTAQSDIYMRTYANGSWSDEMRVSTSPANDWEPAIAAGASSAAYIAWDSYDQGNYDVFFRAYENGELGDIEAITSSPRFQAHASVAVDPQNRPWVAWDESGANWGKDQGYLITPPLAVPLHQERSIRLAMRDGKQWMEPKQKLKEFYVYRLFPNFENPHIVFDGQGVLTMVFRHWTRQNARGIGSRLGWENYLARFDGSEWTPPVPLAHSRGSIEKRPALVQDEQGDIWAAWMTDNRLFTTMVPQNADIYLANLRSFGSPPSYGSARFQTLSEPFAEEVPVHTNEKQDVKAIRDYTLIAGDKKYKIYRGDMHRHTDVSTDFKYDGSLIEVYRYALDAAALDYFVPTDHQSGFDQEFTWWQDEKLADLFHLPGTFTPMFGYERSIRFPNGHRNVIFAHRGVRTLPIPGDEARGAVGAAKLYQYLHANKGISMPHSSGTTQGTDWRDNDPQVEPLMEIYQGYRASYEYLGAPLAASEQKLREQRSGFNALGYWWNALAKGYKIGVQASSDHWSTHISYACIVSESFTREGLLDAMRKRHAYGATDNIILDFQATVDDSTYIMGDVIQSKNAPRLKIRAIGTDAIKQLVIVKNEQFVYSSRPNAKEVSLEFTDGNFQPGSNYYYLRVLQTDGRVAWSSPIWVE